MLIRASETASEMPSRRRRARRGKSNPPNICHFSCVSSYKSRSEPYTLFQFSAGTAALPSQSQGAKKSFSQRQTEAGRTGAHTLQGQTWAAHHLQSEATQGGCPKAISENRETAEQNTKRLPKGLPQSDLREQRSNGQLRPPRPRRRVTVL